MKKAFAILLTLSLLLALAACGEPDATGDKNTNVPQTTTTAPNTTVELVTAYETATSSSMGSFSMAFTYAEGYRSGTMVMTKDGQDAPGTFTCDENYNINHMEIDLEKVEAEKTVLVIDCTFDEAHRILSAKIQLKDAEEVRLLYSAEYSYDSEGRRVYSKVEIPDKYTSITSTEYREDGQVLRVSTEHQFNGMTNGSVIVYNYNEEGRIKSIAVYDSEGNLHGEMAATYEVKEDGIHYTLEEEGGKMVMVVNEQGRAVLQQTYNGGEVINRIETEYDEAGRTIRVEQWVAYTNTTTVITYAYTADGRLQESKQVTGEQETIAQRTTFQTVEIPA